MSTRSVIAVYTDKSAGKFVGTYHHWDGYPTGLGRSLWHLYHTHYKGLLPAMIEMLIYAHPEGWSSIVSADWTQRPTWLDPGDKMDLDADKWPPLAYKYRVGMGEAPNLFNEVTDGGQEWAYVFDLEANTMTILERVGAWDDVAYAEKATVPLNGTEPDWESFE